ncbi:MAG: hypothetical protein AB7P40_00170 [Chloroflexota bacterium]
MSYVIRLEATRREGARGEIATVEDRLQRVQAIMGRRQLMQWRSVLWNVEQLRRVGELLGRRYPSDQTACAVVRIVDGLDDALAESDALMTEARAETTGAIEHLDEAVASLRIDLHYADQYRLYAAGLNDEQIRRPRADGQILEAAS